MRVVVPFDAVDPKTRLAPALDERERQSFARAMLGDVLAALGSAGVDAEVLATAPVSRERVSDDAGTGDPDGEDGGASLPSFRVTVDERPLTPAVNSVLEASLSGDSGSVGVVMADLALATPAAIERLLAAEGEVVLVPGRGGGTNALVARHPGFRVDYHGVSYRDHRRSAREAGADVTTVDSFRLSTDVDERGDLPEVLLHGGERSRRWLTDHGFRVTVTDGRVTLKRG